MTDPGVIVREGRSVIEGRRKPRDGGSGGRVFDDRFRSPTERANGESGVGLRFELAAGNTGLANDGLQRADANFRMTGDRNGHGCRGQLLLHYDVTAASSDLDEAMTRQDGTHLLAGEDKELTQPRPQGG